MNPTTIAIATTIKSIIPTIAMKGFIGYNAHMMMPPTTMKTRAITTPTTASIIPLKVHTSMHLNYINVKFSINQLRLN
jgi:hypothetical protein